MPSSFASLSAEDRRTLRSLVAAVLSMQVLTPFLQSGVAVLLPALGREYACSAAELGLVSTVYCLALAIFNLAMGRAGDKWGRRRVCLMSMVILTPTVALVGFCPDIHSVIALRFFQGMGTAAFSTSSLAMLVASSPPDIRGRLLGITTTGVHVGLSIGPLAGGCVNELLGWRFFFWGISGWALCCFFLMLFLVRREWRDRPDDPYDWPGLVLFACALSLLVLGAAGEMPGAWRPWAVGAGALALAAFLAVECRRSCAMPLLDIRVLMRSRIFVLSSLAAFTTYAALFALTFFFSLYLQYVKGMDSARAGSVIFINPMVQILCIWPGGWLSDRVGAPPVALAGILITTVSIFCGVFLDAASPLWQVAAILAANGLGMALFVTPNTVLIMGSAGREHLGEASGMVGTMRTGGMVLSMVIATSALRAFLGDAAVNAGNLPLFLEAMRTGFLVFSGLCGLSLLFSLLRMRGT